MLNDEYEEVGKGNQINQSTNQQALVSFAGTPPPESVADTKHQTRFSRDGPRRSEYRFDLYGVSS